MYKNSEKRRQGDRGAGVLPLAEIVEGSFVRGSHGTKDKSNELFEL